jgi:hypothetical protein
MTQEEMIAGLKSIWETLNEFDCEDIDYYSKVVEAIITELEKEKKE